MNNASRMRIICDPFKKEIEYQWYDSNIEDYVEFDPENSKLASEEFVYATIQNRAYEIVDLINRECNVGNVGLEIVFVGTEDDYSDFCDVISTFFGVAFLECIRDEHFYNTAAAVMPKIKEKFSEVKETLEEYTEDEISKLVYKYSDAVKPSISLCMMGLYSAGKSAFINSIIGAEVLPSDSNPTTAKVCKIVCADEYTIKFEFDNKPCILTFKGGNYKPNSNFNKEIIKELQNILNGREQPDEIYHMNAALSIINNYKDNSHNISDIIEISLPFRKTKLPIDDFEFVIYDTPGSNSKNNEKHFEVLRNSLDSQTNALPIFVTTPDTMDAEDNDKILSLIESTGTALDITNTIIIVNRADEKDPDTLEEKKNKCKELGVTKWKSTRIFFVSSLIGVASKKNDPNDSDQWIDKNLKFNYKKNKSLFAEDDIKLYEYNIIDKSKKDILSTDYEEGASAHFYKNSGLEAVEREIVEYAKRYALYNKCQQASLYLQEAIDLCVENVMEVEDKLKDALTEAKGHFDSKKKSLCDSLEEKKKNIATYNAEFQNLISQDYEVFIEQNNLQDSPESKKKIHEKLQVKWKELKDIEKKEKKDKSWAFSQIQQFADELYNGYLKTFSQGANKHIVSFWDKKSEQFKEECKKVVHDSDALTDEQKHILESIVLSKDNMSTYRMDFNLRQIGAIRHKHFLIWELKSEKFDIKLCCNQLIQKFNDAVRKRITNAISTNEKNFINWTNGLINTLTVELCKFNSDLSSYEQKIEEIKRDIDSKKNCEQMLSLSKEYIDELLNIQGGEIDE